jgi:hypothetical protein
VLRDQTGRALALPAPPRRIVSLVPSVTEILFAIGAQAVLVGVTDFCDYPPEARKKPSVGGMVAPSLETIVALKPDLVVVTSAGKRGHGPAERLRSRLRRQPTRWRRPTSRPPRALTGRLAEAGALVACWRRLDAGSEATLPVPVLYVLGLPAHRAGRRLVSEPSPRRGSAR